MSSTAWPSTPSTSMGLIPGTSVMSTFCSTRSSHSSKVTPGGRTVSSKHARSLPARRFRRRPAATRETMSQDSDIRVIFRPLPPCSDSVSMSTMVSLVEPRMTASGTRSSPLPIARPRKRNSACQVNCVSTSSRSRRSVYTICMPGHNLPSSTNRSMAAGTQLMLHLTSTSPGPTTATLSMSYWTPYSWRLWRLRASLDMSRYASSPWHSHMSLSYTTFSARKRGLMMYGMVGISSSSMRRSAVTAPRASAPCVFWLAPVAAAVKRRLEATRRRPSPTLRRALLPWTARATRA
mmetsp:Transcript_43987/g.111264  ORF Transcript_43987/g.111264 Transcript_43987/m.111264 type:complete len:293 (+) Transcript_43987:86-964(+)